MTFLCSCGLRSLNFFCDGGVYAFGGRFGLLLCPAIIPARSMSEAGGRPVFAFGGRFAPEFCRSFCGLRASCCCCRRSCLCCCLCCGGDCCRGDCCGGGWLCCLGGLLSCRFCSQFARGPCADDGTASAALIPSANNHPANWSLDLMSGYIC